MGEPGAGGAADHHPAVRVLGPASVHGPVAVLAIGSPLRRRLLTALALRRGQAVERDTLVEWLWPDGAPRTARNTLQVHLSGLRAVLRDAGAHHEVAVVTVGGGYRLDAPDHAVDVARVERCVDAAARARRAGTHAEVVAHLDEALRWWHDDECPDAPAALAADVARLASVRRSAEDDRWAALVLCGRSHEALDELVRGVEREPLREHRVGLLAVSLYRAGRQSDALRVLAATRRRLRDELGCDPGPELERLEQRILAHTAGHDPDASDGTAGTEAGRGPDAAGTSARAASVAEPASRRDVDAVLAGAERVVASGARRRDAAPLVPEVEAALRWVQRHEPATLGDAVARLTFFWFTTGALTEGRAWFRRARRSAGDVVFGAELGAALLAWWQGDYAEVRRRLRAVPDVEGPTPPTLRFVRASMAWLDADLERAERHIAPLLDADGEAVPAPLRAIALAMAASIAWYDDRPDEAARRYALCATVAAHRGDRWTRAFARRHGVLMAALAGTASPGADVMADENEVLRDGPGDALSRGQALVLCGSAALERGDLATARARLAAGLEVAAGPFDAPALLLAAADLAHLAATEQRVDLAARLAGWVDGWTAALGLPLPPAQRRRLAALVPSGSAAADERASSAARAAAMTASELVGMVVEAWGAPSHGQPNASEPSST